MRSLEENTKWNIYILALTPARKAGRLTVDPHFCLNSSRFNSSVLSPDFWKTTDYSFSSLSTPISCGPHRFSPPNSLFHNSFFIPAPIFSRHFQSVGHSDHRHKQTNCRSSPPAPVFQVQSYNLTPELQQILHGGFPSRSGNWADPGRIPCFPPSWGSPQHPL